MSDIFTPFDRRKLNAKNKALLAEWREIHELCQLREDISYTVVMKNKNDLPVIYDIIYKIPSFIGLDKNRQIDRALLKENDDNKEFLFYPLFGDIHRMQITIPPNFPQVNGKPKGSISTKIWHPNIVCHGDDNIVGRVCFNEGNLDASVTIVDRILQVADYLTYKNYLAEDREPYPYDLEVAHWIREIAEPLGWVIPEHGINYKKLGIKHKDPKPKNNKKTNPKTLVDEEIVILDDKSDGFEFTPEMIEDTKEDEDEQNEFIVL